MSRIGKRPIALPQGVTATLNGNVIAVKGKKNSLTRDFAPTAHVALEMVNGTITVKRLDETTDSSREQGLVWALVRNMVTGVDQGFRRDLDIQGVGFRAEVKGKTLAMTLGFSHPVSFDIPEGITITVDKQTRLSVTGPDCYLVGETAAKIRGLKPPEPYKGKGIRYLDEIVRRKAGKAAVGAGAKAGG